MDHSHGSALARALAFFRTLPGPLRPSAGFVAPSFLAPASGLCSSNNSLDSRCSLECAARLLASLERILAVAVGFEGEYETLRRRVHGDKPLSSPTDRAGLE